MASNCGQCLGQQAPTSHLSLKSAPVPQRQVQAFLPTRATISHPAATTTAATAALGASPGRHPCAAAAGDSPSIPPLPPVPAKKSEESATDFGLDYLPDCDCKVPLLARIRELTNQLKKRGEEQEMTRIARDAAEEISRKLREQLSEWSQASSYFEEEKGKIQAQLHRVRGV